MPRSVLGVSAGPAGNAAKTQGGLIRAEIRRRSNQPQRQHELGEAHLVTDKWVSGAFTGEVGGGERK